MCTACDEGEKEVRTMPVYNIFRKYQIEAANPTQALRKLLDALDAKRMRTTTFQTVSVRLMSNQATAN
jgi:hypothetical protein